MIEGLNRSVAWTIRTTFLWPGWSVDADAGNPDGNGHVERTRIGPDKQAGVAEQLAELKQRRLGRENGMATGSSHYLFPPR